MAPYWLTIDHEWNWAVPESVYFVLLELKLSLFPESHAGTVYSQRVETSGKTSHKWKIWRQNSLQKYIQWSLSDSSSSSARELGYDVYSQPRICLKTCFWISSTWSTCFWVRPACQRGAAYCNTDCVYTIVYRCVPNVLGNLVTAPYRMFV